MKNGKLRIAEDGMLSFYCPGCKCHHSVYVDGSGHPVWGFNGNYERPTLTPSVLVTSGHFISGHTGHCWCDYNKEHPEDPVPNWCYRCHSFITDGKIQYLSDCSHELAGQTVDMVEPK